MEGTATICPTPAPSRARVCIDNEQASPFSQQWVTITRQEHIDLKWRASYWEAQHARLKFQLEEVRQDNLVKDAKIKDLQNRLFGRKSEKDRRLKSEKDGPDDSQPKRKRGQQPGSAGHGRTWPDQTSGPSRR